jgi:hypothetical protein
MRRRFGRFDALQPVDAVVQHSADRRPAPGDPLPQCEQSVPGASGRSHGSLPGLFLRPFDDTFAAWGENA